MKIDQAIQEMDGKISLTDNKKFMYCICFIGLYYVTYISWLTLIIFQVKRFH
jgi:hypothetical protein